MDINTRDLLTIYYQLIHPYCQLDTENSNISATGTQIFNNTIAVEGIAGRTSTTPFVPGENEPLKPTTLNKIKGGIPYNKCANFKYGFSKNVQYSFRF